VEKDVRSEPEAKSETVEPPTVPAKASATAALEPEIKPKSDASGEKKAAQPEEAATAPQKRKRPSKQGEPKP
jgi:hypothetical protein